MRGSNAQNYSDKDDPVEQEAARFLLSNFTSEKGHNASDDEHLHAGPVIREITGKDRLHTWIDVAKEHSERVAKADRDALRQRLRELSVDEDVAFGRASEMSVDAESDTAVADGGAVVEEDSEPNSGVSSSGDWEIGPDQEAMEYEDEAEKQLMKNKKRRTVQDLVNTVDEAESALETQYAKDVVPLHTVELLEERLEELEQ